MKTAAKKTICAILALALLIAPVSSFAGAGAVPAEFDAHDAAILRAFFEIEDENGIKNGEKLFAIYDPLDPSTWVGSADTEPGFGWYGDMVRWNEDGSLLGIVLTERDLVGALEIDGAEGLNYIYVDCNRISAIQVTNCPGLRYIHARHNELTSFYIDESVNFLFNLLLSYNRLEEIDLSAMDTLLTLMVDNNRLTSLDLTGIEQTDQIDCSNNELTRLILSDIHSPAYVDCSNNRLSWIGFSASQEVGFIDMSGNLLTHLDLAFSGVRRFDVQGCPLSYLKMQYEDSIVELDTDGHGDLGASFEWKHIDDEDQPTLTVLMLTLFAYAHNGYDFDAWYDENGAWAYFYEEQDIPADELNDMCLTAVFEPNGEPIDPPPSGGSGDVNGDGQVTLTDALLALRCAMGIIQLTGEHLAAADYNGSGNVDVNDALLILRKAMGLI